MVGIEDYLSEIYTLTIYCVFFLTFSSYFFWGSCGYCFYGSICFIDENCVVIGGIFLL